MEGRGLLNFFVPVSIRVTLMAYPLVCVKKASGIPWLQIAVGTAVWTRPCLSVYLSVCLLPPYMQQLSQALCWVGVHSSTDDADSRSYFALLLSEQDFLDDVSHCLRNDPQNFKGL